MTEKQLWAILEKLREAKEDQWGDGHPLFPPPSISGPTACPSPHRSSLASRKFSRVAQSFFPSPLGATTPSSFAPLLFTLSPLYTHKIRDVAPPTAPRLPAVSLCISYQTGFPLPLVRLPPLAYPMSHLLIALLSSPCSVAGTLCVSPLYSSPFTPKGSTSPTHTIKSPAPQPYRKFPTPWYLLPPVELVPPASPRPAVRA